MTISDVRKESTKRGIEMDVGTFYGWRYASSKSMAVIREFATWLEQNGYEIREGYPRWSSCSRQAKVEFRKEKQR